MSGQGEPDLLDQLPTPPPQQPPAGFSQEDINRIAAREKEEGRRSGERSLLEKLGFSSTDEAKTFLEKFRAAEAEKLTEADRKTKEADDKHRKAEELEAEANKRLIEINIKAELLEAGLPKKDVDMVKAMVQSEDLTPTDDSKIKERVKELKKAMPHLFDLGGSGGPPGSHPASPGSTTDTRSPQQKALELLHQRHPQTAKKE